jgi:YHS domain-containing protein
VIALGWLLRVILVLLIIRLIASAFSGGGSRATGGPQRPPRPRPSSPEGAERAGGTLRRDPQCGTYVTEARAIRATTGTETHFFCSTNCRDAYRAAHSSVA